MSTDKTGDEFNIKAAEIGEYVDIADLHATQMRVGYIEIEQKRHDMLEKADKDKLQDYLRLNPVVVVLGPPGITDTKPFPSLMEMAQNIDKIDGKPKTGKIKSPPSEFDGHATVFVVDHHHSTLAASRVGLTTMPMKVLHDYSHLTVQEFWDQMWKDNLLNLNNSGPEGSFDDPYRTLARSVRKAGGYLKAEALYEEFQWANFFRDKIDVKLIHQLGKTVEKGGDWTKCDAVKQGIALAKSAAAKDLPGFNGTPVAVAKAKQVRKP